MSDNQNNIPEMENENLPEVDNTDLSTQENTSIIDVDNITEDNVDVLGITWKFNKNFKKITPKLISL